MSNMDSNFLTSSEKVALNKVIQNNATAKQNQYVSATSSSLKNVVKYNKEKQGLTSSLNTSKSNVVSAFMGSLSPKQKILFTEVIKQSSLSTYQKDLFFKVFGLNPKNKVNSSSSASTSSSGTTASSGVSTAESGSNPIIGATTIASGSNPTIGATTIASGLTTAQKDAAIKASAITPENGTIPASNTSSSGAGSSGGSRVDMNFNNLLDLSARMMGLNRDYDESFNEVNSGVIGKLDDAWRGLASEKYKKELITATNSIYPERIDEIKKMLNDVNDLVEQNVQVGNQLIDKVFTDINMSQTISAVEADVNGRAVDQDLLNSVSTNDNIKATESDVASSSLNNITSNVGVESTINSVESDVTASTVNTELNNSVGVNDNITGNTVDANYFDSRNLTEVQTSNAFNNSSSNVESINVGNLDSINSVVNKEE